MFSYVDINIDNDCTFHAISGSAIISAKLYVLCLHIYVVVDDKAFISYMD